ncbi:2'-5' RNA ligase family protein [Alkalihalobacillus sp. TS-13]|uniref:2'-5' RNA ligase family protein n=1 Tax=Alkalihalobacillus sp. TS-13 TaxID=2842455 RepID=UPI001C8867B0|nr:2'-5' RNA ligase family protein [Alkalihalobacillus sp. TS-13]
MKYAVELFFDENTEGYVKSIWEGLKNKGITSKMADIQEIRPHITLAVYHAGIPIEQYIRTFKNAVDKLSSFKVKFESLSVFPPSGDFPTSVVFAPPTMTTQLFNIHQQFYKDFQEYTAYANELYLPENWTPHCTYAIGLDDEAMSKTLNYCHDRFEPKECTITEIGVVEIRMEDLIPSSKTIFSKQLT